MVKNVTKKLQSNGKEEKNLSEPFVPGNVIPKENLYTPKEVFRICMFFCLMMLVVTYVFVTEMEPPRGARLAALENMCYFYAGGGVPKQIQNGTHSFTVICSDDSLELKGDSEWDMSLT